MAKSNKPQLLIITNYYPPEIGAASNRIYQLAQGLKSDYAVKVLTPLPNYPTGRIFKGFRNKLISKTEEEGIELHRLWIYASASKNAILRFFAMLSYSISLGIYFLRTRKPDKVIIQSPPLLVAFTSVFFLNSKRRRLTLNVSDLWPRAGLELGALRKNWFYVILKRMERYNYMKADVILGQSLEILEHINTFNTDAKLQLYRNYPVVEQKDITAQRSRNRTIKIVYAGLLGVAQGILKLCQHLNYDSIELHIYGTGPEEKDLSNFIDSNGHLPIFIHGKIERHKLHEELIRYDIAIVPLLKRIYGSVPSKIFELTKLGLPILYFGGGEGETIVKKYDLGWIAESGNYEQLNKVITSLNHEAFSLEKKQAIKNTAINVFSFEEQLLELKNVL